MSFVLVDGKLQLKEESIKGEQKNKSINSEIIYQISKFWNDAYFEMYS